MSSHPAPTFGKRQAPALVKAGSERSTLARPESASIVAFDAWGEEDAERPLIVPNSVGAGILTGSAIGVLHLAANFHELIAAAGQAGALAVEGHEIETMPVILIGGLYAGARAGFASAFMVHAVLRRIGRTGLMDYCIGGGLVALLSAGLMQALGLGGPDEGWPLEVVLGLAAGALYRLFAGAAPAER